MQFINFLAIFLGFLGLAIAQDAAATTSIVSSSTETSTRTIRVSQVSTVTSVVTSSTEVPSSSSVYVTASQNSTMTTMGPSSTKMTLSASAPLGTGNVVPTKAASPPLPSSFEGAAPALSAFGAAGAIAMAFAVML